jgi:hypothetical protein
MGTVTTHTLGGYTCSLPSPCENTTTRLRRTSAVDGTFYDAIKFKYEIIIPKYFPTAWRQDQAQNPNHHTIRP